MHISVCGPPGPPWQIQLPCVAVRVLCIPQDIRHSQPHSLFQPGWVFCWSPVFLFAPALPLRPNLLIYQSRACLCPFSSEPHPALSVQHWCTPCPPPTPTTHTLHSFCSSPAYSDWYCKCSQVLPTHLHCGLCHGICLLRVMVLIIWTYTESEFSF